MALKVELKPGERFILGTSVITNDNQRTRLYIQGDAPVLREKDILTAETADTPAKRIYLAVQLMYLGMGGAETRELYFKLINELVESVPSTLPYVDRISNQVLTESFYKGLREAKALIQYETELLQHAQRSSSLRTGGTADGQSA